MTFQTLEAVAEALAFDDKRPSPTRYRVHLLIDGVWFAFSADNRVWSQTHARNETGKQLSLNQALSLILRDVREWVGDESDCDEIDRRVRSYKLIKVESGT